MNWTVNIPMTDWVNNVKIARYEKAMSIANGIVDNKWSCRQAAKESCVAKSTVSLWIEKYVKFLDPELYETVKYIFRVNKKHTNARRRYYL